ncbi:MAG TPA: DUF6152 family protein [Terriglobia bacterium]|nr:DUF6152 family protein [Terriglobia bacterium]
MNSKRGYLAGLTLVMMMLAVTSASAHHGFGAFDRTTPITLTGVVKSVEWINPHAIVYIDVKGDDGKTVTWAIQAAPPNLLVRMGMPRDTLQPGAVFAVTGYAPKADLTDFVFAPSTASTFVRSGHLVYSYDVKIVTSAPRSVAGSTVGR